MLLERRTPVVAALVIWFLGAPEAGAASKPKVVSTATNGNCYSPRWSHDGKKLSYEVHFPGKETKETYIVDFGAGGKVSRVSPDMGPDGMSAFEEKGPPPVKELAWHPKGRAYVYSSTGGRRLFELFMEGEGVLTADPSRFGPGNKHQPQWSPDGKYLVYAKEEVGGGDLFLIDIYNLEKGETRLTHADGATSYQPRWSPEGKRIVFTRFDEDSSENDLFIIDDFSRAKETTRQLTKFKGDELNPSWSPDGKSIAFYSNTGKSDGKIFDLYVVPAAGGQPKLLVRDVIKPDRNGPVWTPDSGKLLFVGRDHVKEDPIRWVEVDNAEHTGEVVTGTQLNDDLQAFVEGESIRVAFTAQAEKGDRKKTWRKVYVTEISLSDLK